MEKAPHLLLVEDDAEIGVLVSRFMTDHGFRVTRTPDGRQLERIMSQGRVDFVVLDVMLPGEDGLSICRRLRAQSAVPILMLTALGSETDRIVGLEMGADDYLPKPFSPRELLARVRAVMRRGSLAEAAAGQGRAGRSASASTAGASTSPPASCTRRTGCGWH